VDADESILVPAARAIPIGLIVNELVTNAVKHAFPSSMTGTIEVQARRSSSDRVSLLIRDDGVGMQPNARQGSLGYGIVRSLVNKIGGEITVGRDVGVAVTLTFPG
jgi:two-component sensor histidine kinase